MQTTAKKETKTGAGRANSSFLIRSIDLDAILISVPVWHYKIFFCIQVLLTRASILAPAKSIYYQEAGGGSVVEWFERRTCNSEATSSSPALTASWIFSR